MATREVSCSCAWKVVRVCGGSMQAGMRGAFVGGVRESQRAVSPAGWKMGQVGERPLSLPSVFYESSTNAGVPL